MPASPIAIALLEFGKLLSDEERRYYKDRGPAKPVGTVSDVDTLHCR